jgi:hypothetical protein
MKCPKSRKRGQNLHARLHFYSSDEAILNLGNILLWTDPQYPKYSKLLLKFRTNHFYELPFLQMIMNELRNHGCLSDSKRLELRIVGGGDCLGR